MRDFKNSTKMILEIYLGSDELGDHLSIDGIVNGEKFSLGSIDVEALPDNLHDVLMLKELNELASMKQLTKLNGELHERL